MVVEVNLTTRCCRPWLSHCELRSEMLRFEILANVGPSRDPMQVEVRTGWFGCPGGGWAKKAQSYLGISPPII